MVRIYMGAVRLASRGIFFFRLSLRLERDKRARDCGYRNCKARGITLAAIPRRGER